MQLGGFGTPPWIEKVSRKLFRDSLIGASKEFAAEERREMSEAFRPWAEATGEMARLKRFADGEVFREFNPAKTLRPFAVRAVSFLRRPNG